jgi:uncharacterized DUF497 family protein
MASDFEWDPDKAESNLAKHGISFQEARTAFDDPDWMDYPDEEHSVAEDRWIGTGFSVAGRLLVVWYTWRGESIRLIGCRRATSAEYKRYARRTDW